MIHELGPRTGRIFDLLHDRILSGELAPGARLPPHTRLAAEFGVAPMTIRNVLARLEAAGLVSRELGRGTFVRTSARPAVLVLAAADLQVVLGEFVRRAGHPLILCDAPNEALGCLGSSRAIGLVLCELGSTAPRGIADFVRGVRGRWPRLALAVMTGSAADLAAFQGYPDGPVLVLPTPLRANQVQEVLRLALLDTQAAASRSMDDLFARLSEPALVLDRSTRRVVACNPAALSLLGYSGAAAQGMLLETLVPPGVLLELASRGVAILDATSPVELPLVRADGQEVWVELAASAVAEGRVVLVARDRTVQRADHDALSLRARLLEAVEQAVIATDTHARILYWNRGAERLYGWTADEVLGRNAGEVIVAPRLLERGLEIMTLLREGKSWTGEFAVRRRDGIQVPVLVTDSPIRGRDGELIGIIGVSLDLSERKQAERERFERVRLEALLLATEAAQRELSEQLALNVPYVGQLANDPRLPRHLRPIAGVVLAAMREVATRLEQTVEVPEEAS